MGIIYGYYMDTTKTDIMKNGYQKAMINGYIPIVDTHMLKDVWHCMVCSPTKLGD